MKDKMKVEIISIWDGKDKETSKISELSLFLPDVVITTKDFPMQWNRNMKFCVDVDKKIQPIADRIFGQAGTIVRCAKLTTGSLEILLYLMVTAGTVFKFFKDYDPVRKGVIQFVKDVGTTYDAIRMLIQKHYSTIETLSASDSKNHNMQTRISSTFDVQEYIRTKKEYLDVTQRKGKRDETKQYQHIKRYP